MSERTWYVARMKHKTLPLAVKAVIGLDLAADAVPEDTPLMQYLDPLTSEQARERHAGSRDLLESGAGMIRVWVDRESFGKNTLAEAGADPDLAHGAPIGRHGGRQCYLAELEYPLVAIGDGKTGDDYDRALMGGHPFFVLGSPGVFRDGGNVAKWYGNHHGLMKNGWSFRRFAEAVADPCDDKNPKWQRLYHVWPTPGRVKAQGRSRKRAATVESRRLREKAKAWGLVFKDGDHLNTAGGNIRIDRKVDQDDSEVEAALVEADKRAERLVKSYLSDVFNLCAWRRLAGKSVKVTVLDTKLVSAGARWPDIPFPTASDMKVSVGRLRSPGGRWALNKQGKWQICCARHLEEAAKSIEAARTAADRRRGIVRTRFGVVRLATFRCLVAAVRELPLPDKEWFETVVAGAVFKKRRKNIARYRAEVSAFLKSQAEREG